MTITGFAGEQIAPGGERYDQARRVWNAAIDRRPALIARAQSTADVVAAVRYAREESLPLSVRGGGHSTAGLGVADGAVLLDLSAMKAVAVDPLARVAVAAPGLTWAELDAATQANGLATTGAAAGSAGIAGMTLGGGIGRLDRLAGLSCDNLTEAEVVTADGRVLTASAAEHPDLLWALRGGGGNFGVVTSLSYGLHPVTRAYGGILAYPADHAADVLRAYAHVAEHAPEELALYCVQLTAPPLPFIPEGLRGQRIAGLLAFHFGAARAAERTIASLRALLPPPAADLTGPMSYAQTQQMGDGLSPDGMHHYDIAEWLSFLDDTGIEALVSAVAHATSPRSSIVLKRMGGATARVPAEATAFWYRQAAHNLNVHAEWTPGGDAAAHQAWANAAWRTARRASAGGGYIHFIGEDQGSDRVRAAYGGNYERLAQVKAAYDPDNFFRVNHNIAPAGEPARADASG